jgi:hypothetical protein
MAAYNKGLYFALERKYNAAYKAGCFMASALAVPG